MTNTCSVILALNTAALWSWADQSPAWVVSRISSQKPRTKWDWIRLVLAVFQQRSGGVVAKVGSLTPMLQPGATSAPGTPPQKVQKPSYEPFLLTSSDGCLNWVRTIDCPANWNRAKNGSLLLLLPSFWRESTFINRVHPSHNRITPVNITWALSIFAATHPSNILYLSLHWLISSSYDWSALYCFVCVLESMKSISVQRYSFLGQLIFWYYAPTHPFCYIYCRFPTSSLETKLLFSFPSGQEIFSLGATSNPQKKRQTIDKLRRTFSTRWWGRR